MTLLVDALVHWLVGLLADTGLAQLATFVGGTPQERALRSAVTAAVEHTAAELCSGDEAKAEALAMVVSQLLDMPEAAAPPSTWRTPLEALGSGLAARLADLDDVGITGTEQSSADVLGVTGEVVAELLTSHVIHEILARGADGGPLSALASQLNHNVTQLKVQEIDGKIDALAGQMLTRLASLNAARALAAAPTVLAQLPPPTSGFTGRDDYIDNLIDLLNPEGSSGPVAVLAVAGLPGVGKTALAVAAAHAAVEYGWFGRGVLFIDLHGYEDAPVEPAQALDSLLRALGVSPDDIPPELDGRTAQYRSTLAQGEPVLVIADNARSEAQVRPLVPGAGLHKVLITSRHTLAGLGARLVDVKELDVESSAALLNTALRTARPDDDRISIAPDAAKRLARACGGLPLALQITAALLIADPATTAAELADELAAESARLDRLVYDDGSVNGMSSVAVAFELSYRRLGDTPRRVFRLLPLNPGPDVSTAATAILADVSLEEARNVLRALHRAHLVEATAGSTGRWRMHDLVRLYAARLGDEHAEADGREQAQNRLLDYYLDTAYAANAHLRKMGV